MNRSTSGDAVAGNRDLMTDIFLRLPARDVLRCMCVCKQWLALISNPHFRYSHTLHLFRNNSYPRALLLPDNNNGNMKVCVVPFTNNDQCSLVAKNICEFVSSIIQSCNGLLLCAGYTPSQKIDSRTKIFHQRCNYYVINPAISSCFDHISYNSSKPYPHLLMPFLSYEPRESPYYKVILFIEFKHGVEISVYSSETKSWSDPVILFTKVPVKFGAYCNGIVHWFSPLKTLIYFDINKFCFNELQWTIPSYDFCLLHVRYFRESGGNMYLVLANVDRELEYDIWELEKDYCGWVLKYHMDLNHICEGLVLSLRNYNGRVPMSVVCQENEEEDSVVVFIKDSNDKKMKVLSYNLNNHGSRILHELDKEFFCNSFQYFETLSWTIGFDHV
ncbi:hypothetical protein PIB30_062122 [Stylosanthes scabra]|uniref:F-box domain-containing protein n=1 Tax=Stylosanthes scabra TaxID=79078 RepID=A0ABU6WPC5_9FABA|nr:hypothetical protein [Stylosanthes scabra]